MYVVLASKSPRRLELLSEIVPLDRIRVIPPKSAAEEGFEGLETLPAIEQRLLEIVRDKREDVQKQVHEEEDHAALRCHLGIMVAADTVVVVPHNDTGFLVLGQPPVGHGAERVVKRWFKEYYVGKAHTVLTGFSLTTPEGESIERIVKSTVTFGEFDGSFTSVIGLPLRELMEVIRERGIDVLRKD